MVQPQAFACSSIYTDARRLMLTAYSPGSGAARQERRQLRRRRLAGRPTELVGARARAQAAAFDELRRSIVRGRKPSEGLDGRQKRESRGSLAEGGAVCAGRGSDDKWTKTANARPTRARAGGPGRWRTGARWQSPAVTGPQSGTLLLHAVISSDRRCDRGQWWRPRSLHRRRRRRRPQRRMVPDGALTLHATSLLVPHCMELSVKKKGAMKGEHSRLSSVLWHGAQLRSLPATQRSARCSGCFRY